MKQADSVRIVVEEEVIRFTFYNDEYADDGSLGYPVPMLVRETVVEEVTVPKGICNEIAIFTGDDEEHPDNPYDYTDWFAARKPWRGPQ